MSPLEINDQQFGTLTGLVPAFETPALNGSPARLWYKVCRLDADPVVLRAQTFEFVRNCQFARERAAGKAPINPPAGSLERARTLRGKLEPAGQYQVPAQDHRTADRRHAEVVNALIAELDRHGILNQKVWSVDGYEVDLAVGEPPGAVLVEVKTSAFAQDVHTGTGQLMLYPKIMPELAHHRRVLLLPEGVTAALRTAVEACDIALHTYIRKDTDGPEPLTITFHPSFRRLCGLP